MIINFEYMCTWRKSVHTSRAATAIAKVKSTHKRSRYIVDQLDAALSWDNRYAIAITYCETSDTQISQDIDDFARVYIERAVLNEQT